METSPPSKIPVDLHPPTSPSISRALWSAPRSGIGANEPGIEETLLAISRSFITSKDEVDVSQALQKYGEAIGAERISLFAVSVEQGDGTQLSLFESEDQRANRIHLDGHYTERSSTSVVVTELSPTPETENNLLKDLLDDQSSGHFVPIMSAMNRFYGYLDVTYSSEETNSHLTSAEKSHSLHRMSHLLASYFEQRDQQSIAVADSERKVMTEESRSPVLVRDHARILYANEAAAALFGVSSPHIFAGRPISDFIEAQSLLDKQWNRLEQGYPSEEPVEHAIIRKDGEERVVQSFQVSTTYKGHRAAQVILHDVTEQRRSEERYRNFMQMSAEGLWCFTVKPSLSVDRGIQEGVHTLWERGRLTECNDVMAQIMNIPEGDTLSGKLLQEVAPESIKSVLARFLETDNYKLHDQQFSVQSEDGSERHFLLSATGTVRKKGITHICGTCLDITDRIEEERRMVEALEHQQNTIGRELHDNVGQLLTSIRMLSETLASQQQDGKLTERTGRIAHLAGEASEQISSIYQGLSAQHLQDTSLASALKRLTQRTDELSAISCFFYCDENSLADALDQEQKLQLYRIAQEAVNNAVKHAQPSGIRIDLKITQGRDGKNQIELVIQDDGVGFDPEHSGNAESLGVHSMHYRAQSIGAKLTIRSTPDEGAIVTCMLPIED